MHEHRYAYQHPGLANLILHIWPDRRFNSFEEIESVMKGTAGYAELRFDNGALFPSSLEFRVVPQPSVHKRFQPGEVAALTLDENEGGHFEKFIVEVQDDDGERILASVVQPEHIPVYDSRRSQLRFRQAAGGATSMEPRPDPPWTYVTTVSGLELLNAIALDSESAIVRLDAADIAEIQEWLTTQFVRPVYHFKIYRSAVVTRAAENPRAVTSRILGGLQLFASSHVEAGLNLYFATTEQGNVVPSTTSEPSIVPIHHSFSWPQTQSYRESRPAVDLSDDAIIHQLRNWIGQFTGIEITPDSLMARALSRYSRSLYNDYQVEVITDLVIGLETLLMPARQGEISYRVRQRAGFMVGNTPEERLTFASHTNKAYGVRSGAVHTSEESSDATLEFADECRDLLRMCIRRLLEAELPLRNQFCQVATTRRGRRDDKNEIHRFYEALIAFGSFQQAYEYWHNSSPTGTQSNSSEVQD
jgi:hypothetical protein